MDKVEIGTTQIYEATMSLRSDVLRATEGLSQVRQAVVDLDRRIEQRFADQEARLRALESSRWPLRSITAVVAIAAVVVSIFALWSKAG
jgi:hypothetical protein